MKKHILLCFLCLASTHCFSQEITTTLVDSISYPKNQFKKLAGVDHLENYYFFNFEVITKTNGTQNWVYTNYELGVPHSISVINPLQVLVFYKETNTIVLLDRFLNETQRIDFNQINPIKTAWWVANTKNQEIWIYDGESNVLEFYNYQQNNTLSQTIPFLEAPVNFTSNFNNTYILFEDKIKHYNIQGTLLQTVATANTNTIKATESFVISKLKNSFNLYTTNLKVVGTIKNLKNTDVGFSFKNEKLYIYNGSKLFIYQLTLPKN